MPKQIKIDEVELMTKKIQAAKSAYITEYRGLTVAELYELRKKLREADAEYKVVKNRLTKIALKNTGYGQYADHFKGPIAVVFALKDPVKPAKALVDFAKAHEKLKLKTGFMGQSALDVNQIKALASLPTREVLIGKLVSSLSSPLYGFLRVLNGPISGFTNALDQIRKQKEGTA